MVSGARFTAGSVDSQWAATKPPTTDPRTTKRFQFRPLVSILKWSANLPAPPREQRVSRLEDIPKRLPKRIRAAMIRAIAGPETYQGQVSWSIFLCFGQRWPKKPNSQTGRLNSGPWRYRRPRVVLGFCP